MNCQSMIAVVLSCALLLASCGGGDVVPTAPATVVVSSSQTPPAIQPTANWTADATVEAVVIGARIPCGWGTAVGDTRAGVGWNITIDGSSIRLDEDMGNWPTDDVPYSGTLNGFRFTATYDNGADYLRYVCQFKGGTLSGSFNADFSAFEAAEILVWGPPGGETTVRRQWVGRRF